MNESGMWYAWEGNEMHERFRWGNVKERDRLEDVGVDWRMILTLILKKQDGIASIGFILLSIGTSDCRL